MTQPTAYIPTTDFSQDEANNLTGRSTVRTAQLDAELAAISLTATQFLENLALLQRDDGKLRDSIIETYMLSATILAMFVSIGAGPKGAWLTGTNYIVRDIVETGSPLTPYMCVLAHTSGVFATDYAAGKWQVLGSVVATAGNVTNTPSGGISAVTVQSAINELDSEKVAKASNGSDFSDIATTRTNLSVFSKAESQTSSFLSATATGTFDAIQAAYTPAVTSLTNNQILYVRAIGVNSLTNPTFTPNSGVVAAKPIKKFGGASLYAGDISGADHVLQLQYNSTLDAWLLLNPAGFSATEAQLSSFLVATAVGTPDAIQAAYVPAKTVLTDKQTLYVIASGANTLLTPTFTPNYGVVVAKTIKKHNGASLVIGDIAGINHVLQLQYSATLDAWMLLNPAYAIQPVSTNVSDVARAIRRARIASTIILTV